MLIKFIYGNNKKVNNYILKNKYIKIIQKIILYNFYQYFNKKIR